MKRQETCVTVPSLPDVVQLGRIVLTFNNRRIERTCSPADFLKRWPGSLRPISLSSPRPALPEDCRRLLADFGLPSELTIRCYNDLRIRFSGTATSLATIWDRDLKRGHKLGEMLAGWNRFWHLADFEYVQGGGWICVEEHTGRLLAIDMDLPEPVYLLSSSVRNFYTILAHFLEWTERTGGTPAETIHLRDELRRQDCVPPDELEPFWLNI